MKKTRKTLLGTAVLIIAGCLLIALLTGCSNKKSSEQTQPQPSNTPAVTTTAVQTPSNSGNTNTAPTADPVAMLKPYDDFGCASGNQMQYKLDVDDGRVKVKAYYYTANDDHDNEYYLNASTAKVEGNTVTFTGISTENGQDISGQFDGITFTTNGNSVTMQINRKDGGGGAGQLTGGSYNLAPINSDAYDRDDHDD